MRKKKIEAGNADSDVRRRKEQKKKVFFPRIEDNKQSIRVIERGKESERDG